MGLRVILVPRNCALQHACHALASSMRAAEQAQDLVGVAGDVMAALQPLRPAIEAPAVPEDAVELEHGGSSRPWRDGP